MARHLIAAIHGPTTQHADGREWTFERDYEHGGYTCIVETDEAARIFRAVVDRYRVLASTNPSGEWIKAPPPPVVPVKPRRGAQAPVSAPAPSAAPVAPAAAPAPAAVPDPEPAPAPEINPALAAMSKADLVAEARALGIDASSRMSKPALIAEIIAKQGPTTNGQ